MQRLLATSYTRQAQKSAALNIATGSLARHEIKWLMLITGCPCCAGFSCDINPDVRYFWPGVILALVGLFFGDFGISARLCIFVVNNGLWCGEMAGW